MQTHLGLEVTQLNSMKRFIDLEDALIKQVATGQYYIIFINNQIKGCFRGEQIHQMVRADVEQFIGGNKTNLAFVPVDKPLTLEA